MAEREKTVSILVAGIQLLMEQIFERNGNICILPSTIHKSLKENNIDWL